MNQSELAILVSSVMLCSGIATALQVTIGSRLPIIQGVSFSFLAAFFTCILFAKANPDPEITPEEVAAVRDDAIMATGRSDYPNQVNNVLGFPYIFRGALDVRATTINDDMKIAAAEALAELAREDVPDEVAAAYPGERQHYGPDYIIPAPFDPRLISDIPPAVAQAAMDSGVAHRPIIDMDSYGRELSARLDPSATSRTASMRMPRSTALHMS